MAKSEERISKLLAFFMRFFTRLFYRKIRNLFPLTFQDHRMNH